MKKLFAILLFCIPLVTLTNCGGGTQLPQEVCDVGSVVFNVSDYLCENEIIPPDVCVWINAAKLNFNLLCTVEPESPEYNAALSSLNEINGKLERWLNERKLLSRDSTKVIK